jgi:hypothetical protein
MNTDNVHTSGAYVLYKGLFPFQVGPTRKGDKLGVVRLGGHREGSETAAQTAIREVHEESAMEINLISAPVTYYKDSWNNPSSIIHIDDAIVPVLIKGKDPYSSNAMYLAYSKTEPIPSSETKGLLLLTPEEIFKICKNQFTLKDYLGQNGKAVLGTSIDPSLHLEPFPQLIFLRDLFIREPGMMKHFFINYED